MMVVTDNSMQCFMSSYSTCSSAIIESDKNHLFTFAFPIFKVYLQDVLNEASKIRISVLVGK